MLWSLIVALNGLRSLMAKVGWVSGENSAKYDIVGEFVIVILSEAKNLSQMLAKNQILRFAQNSKFSYIELTFNGYTTWQDVKFQFIVYR